jgi:hypothetical protein
MPKLCVQRGILPSCITLGILLSIGMLGSIRSGQRPLPEERVQARPIEVEGDGFVTSSGCRSCHPSEYATWHASYHRTMTQLATPESVLADFAGAHVAAVHGRPMVLERRGGEFWAEFDNPDWKSEGRQPTRISRRIVMLTGSHHQQVYWYETGQSRILGQLPAVYLIAERQWIPRNAAFLRPGTDEFFSESGRWNRVCIECHATHGKKRLEGSLESGTISTVLADTTVAEFGIGCEACHGPGEPHVRVNRNPLRRYSLHLTRGVESTIVNPPRLNRRLASDACGQCHGIWTSHNRAGERQVNVDGFAYRPGDSLHATRFVVQPTKDLGSSVMQRTLADDPAFVRDLFWPDGMVRVSGREYNGLIESPCYYQGRSDERRLSCTSCHTMHKARNDPRPVAVWADTHQVSTRMDTNDACLQCHSEFGKDPGAHTRHRDDSSGSMCYNCHMPYTSYGLLRAQRSHQISSPDVVATVTTGRPNACNLCHLDKTLQWTAEHLHEWYGTPKVPLEEDERKFAGSVLWLLRGDAGQRALAAWSMGWRAAQHASGTAWMPPYLTLLLNDTYPAVQFIASRSLRSLPGYATFRHDATATSEQRVASGLKVMALWRSEQSRQASPPSVPPLEVNGTPSADVVRLLRQRQDPRVNLAE